MLSDRKLTVENVFNLDALVRALEDLQHEI